MSDNDDLLVKNDREKNWIEYCTYLFPVFRNLTPEEAEAHKNYIYNLFKEQKDSDPEIQKVVNDFFWKLFED